MKSWLRGLDSPAECVGNAGRAHLRRQIVGGHPLGWNQAALLSGIRRLVAAIEEVGDVGVLLGLRGPELGAALLRQDFGQDAGQAEGRKCLRNGEGLVVLRHGDAGEARGGR